MYQVRYWKELDQLKVHVFYLEKYLEKTIQVDRYLNMFLAIVSSGSIASWAVFKEYSFIWGLMIAASQAINAVKVYLPYAKRLKALQGITMEMENLFLEMESEWFNVSEGKLTMDQIHKSHMKFKNKIHQLKQKHFAASPLPPDRVLLKAAEKEAGDYFLMFYNFEESQND